jgi:hypothetical protein
LKKYFDLIGVELSSEEAPVALILLLEEQEPALAL